MQYRGTDTIIAGILQSAMYGATRSKLRCESYLPYPRIKKYLIHLQENEMLIYDERTMLYKTTQSGIIFLRMYDEIKELFVQKKNKDNSIYEYV